MHSGTTITQFLIEEQRRIRGASGDFTSLLNDIVTACKVISNSVSQGGLIGVLGSAGSDNVQGEVQKKLDAARSAGHARTPSRLRSRGDLQRGRVRPRRGAQAELTG